MSMTLKTILYHHNKSVTRRQSSKLGSFKRDNLVDMIQSRRKWRLGKRRSKRSDLYRPFHRTTTWSVSVQRIRCSEKIRVVFFLFFYRPYKPVLRLRYVKTIETLHRTYIYLPTGALPLGRHYPLVSFGKFLYLPRTSSRSRLPYFLLDRTGHIQLV